LGGGGRGGRAITTLGGSNCGGDGFLGKAIRVKLLLTTEKY
jgi:hypothetical protein